MPGRQLTSDEAAEMGRRGSRSLLRRYGTEHMRQIALARQERERQERSSEKAAADTEAPHSEGGAR